MEEAKQSWDAYHIVERGPKRFQWLKIGIAFLNRDQSINILLDVLPKDGKVQLRCNNGNKKQNTKGENL